MSDRSPATAANADRPDSSRPKGCPVPTLVTFVVIAYNEEHGIADCLAAILAQDGNVPADVVVVDDGSTDRTADIVRGFASAAPVRLVAFGENRGRGAARAAGVQAAQGTYIAMVDSDTILPPHWLQTCLAELADDPQCMAVGGIAVPDGDATWVQRFTGLSPLVVPHGVAVTGSNGLYRRAIFDVVSFAPGLRLGEDVALNHELADRGIVTRSLPDLVARHVENKTYVETLQWLYTAGLDASRQLERFHRPRAVDWGTALFWTSVLAAAPSGARRPARAALPAGLVLAMSVFHLRRKLELFERGPAVATKGAVAYSSFIVAYFCGRLVGHGRGKLGSRTADAFAVDPEVSGLPPLPEDVSSLAR